MSEGRRFASLVTAGAVLFATWLAWANVQAPQIVTIYEPYVAEVVLVPVLVPAASPVIAPETPQDAQEQRFTVSAAHTATALVQQTPVGPPEVTFLEFAAVIATTWWPPAEWGRVWTLGGCESPTGSVETVAVHTLGDEDLVPHDGPSLGTLKVNIRAHPDKLLKYNLLELRDNLLAGWEIWEASGRTYQRDWVNCSEWRGLP